MQITIGDAILTASRVLVAVAARSLTAAGEDITLNQYRALVVLCGRGPQTMSALAEELECSPSAATRLCDRLVRKNLVDRTRAGSNRREVVVDVTPAGTALVDAVTQHRRRDIARIVARMPSGSRAELVDALNAFAAAAGEPPEQSWWLGWAP
jgi:DNA-binding MarR family transcriptional regulator